MFSRWASSRARLSTKRQLKRMETKYAQERLDAQQMQEEMLQIQIQRRIQTQAIHLQLQIY